MGTTLISPAIATAITPAEVAAKDYFIATEAEAIKLHLKNKHLAQPASGPYRSTIVMMHGATFASESLFDVPLANESFMDFLARQGFDVWSVDVRGYGRSTRPQAMQADAAASPPLVRTETGVEDFGRAVDFILAHRDLRQLDIIGMSWGGSVTGTYTSRHGDKVRRLGLIAPQWLNPGPVLIDTGGTLGAWRTVSLPAYTERWLDAAPENKRQTLVPPGGLDAWIAVTLAAETDPALREQGKIRATSGAIQDIREFWTAGQPFYHPEDIKVPVMLLHGEWDRDVPLDLARDYFSHLRGAPEKRWLEVGESTHMLVLEKNRYIAYQALAHFFAEPA